MKINLYLLTIAILSSCASPVQVQVNRTPDVLSMLMEEKRSVENEQIFLANEEFCYRLHATDQGAYNRCLFNGFHFVRDRYRPNSSIRVYTPELDPIGGKQIIVHE